MEKHRKTKKNTKKDTKHGRDTEYVKIYGTHIQCIQKIQTNTKRLTRPARPSPETTVPGRTQLLSFCYKHRRPDLIRVYVYTCIDTSHIKVFCIC